MSISGIMQISLLDYLAWQCKCDQISDLRYLATKNWLCSAVEKLPAAAFSSKEWAGAICYLTDDKEASLLHPAEELRSRLISNLSKDIR